MVNENCLEGVRCPRCLSNDRFSIEVKTVVVFTDDGSGDPSDMEWGEDSTCVCDRCDHSGVVSDFQDTPALEFAAEALRFSDQVKAVMRESRFTDEERAKKVFDLRARFGDVALGFACDIRDLIN